MYTRGKRIFQFQQSRVTVGKDTPMNNIRAMSVDQCRQYTTLVKGGPVETSVKRLQYYTTYPRATPTLIRVYVLRIAT